MGAIGGILSQNGKEIDRKILAALSHHQAQIGPDGEHIVTDRRAAFIYRPFLTDPPGQIAERPLRAANGDLLIWNGRLDNQEELQKLLDLPPVTPETPVDTLVYQALKRWDLAALPRLIGDFSLSLWEPRRRRLLLATDIWGLRPVFYHLGSGQLVWASRCRAIFDALSLPAEIDGHYIAGVLIRARPGDRSPFTRIKMLPAAHYLVFEDNQLRTARYWSPESCAEIRYATEEEYEEHFLELLRQAVACRMSAKGTVFAELSGGFDSSSIAGLGDQLVHAGQVAAPKLETVSYVYDRAPTSDERTYISAMEERLGRKGLHIFNEKTPLLSIPPTDGTFRPDFPAGQLIYFARNQFLADRMAERGSRVLLRGMGGDQITWGDAGICPWEIGDHLVRKQWRRAIQACRQWSLANKVPLHQTLWRGGLWPLMPRSVQQRTFAFALPVEAWFNPDFARGLDLRRWTLGATDELDFQLPSQREQYSAVREVVMGVGWEFLVQRGCVECRFPFLDRRLIEFVLATPIERMLRPGETRSLARGALRQILPETVRTRKSKSGPDEAIYRTIARQWRHLHGLAEDPLVGRYGFVDQDAFRTALKRVKHGVTTTVPQLTRTFALEFWLRSLDCRQRASDSPNPPPIRVEQPKEKGL